MFVQTLSDLHCSLSTFEAVNKLYKLNSFRNPEVRFAVLQLALSLGSKDETFVKDAEAFVSEQGRMK